MRVDEESTPPQQQQHYSHSPYKNYTTSQSSSLLRVIGIVIALVLAFHWYLLVLHHVDFHHQPGQVKVDHQESIPSSSAAPAGSSCKRLGVSVFGSTYDKLFSQIRVFVSLYAPFDHFFISAR